MAHTQLLTIGETMAMVTPTTASPLESARDFHIDAGGAESNVASHCAQLGVSSAWISAVGDDPLGRRLVADIAARGVDVSHVRTDAGAPTGVYFKDPGASVHYYRAGSAASRMTPAVLEGVPLADARVVHLSGITPALSIGCAHLVDAAIEAAHAAGAIVTFDINYRPALWDLAHAAPTLRAIGRRADIVFVGLDEAETLWGTGSAEEVRKVFPDGTLVVKDGDVGATEFGHGGSVFVPAHTVEVVEAVGAGDAFAAGYLCAHLQGASPADRLQAGHDRAALVLTSTSDFVTTPGE